VLFSVSLCLLYSVCYSVRSAHKSDQWYQSGLLFIYFSSCMSPTRSGYKKLGLKPIEPLQDRSHRARQKPMGDEKKDDGVGYPFKMLLEESLA
jgi:hypothetical protein